MNWPGCIYGFAGRLLAEYNGLGICVRDYIYMGGKLVAEYRPQMNKKSIIWAGTIGAIPFAAYALMRIFDKQHFLPEWLINALDVLGKPIQLLLAAIIPSDYYDSTLHILFIALVVFYSLIGFLLGGLMYLLVRKMRGFNRQ